MKIRVLKVNIDCVTPFRIIPTTGGSPNEGHWLPLVHFVKR